MPRRWVGGEPAGARQIMYAARRLMQPLIGACCWKNSSTFTQQYLPDFIAEHPEQTAGWNVVYDDRGELIEPHGGVVVGLGTLQVRAYRRGWRGHTAAPASLARGAERVVCRSNAVGPHDRYRFVLLIEKEGFRPLLEHARIAARFDVALAWTKGMSTTACRELIDELSGQG